MNEIYWVGVVVGVLAVIGGIAIFRGAKRVADLFSRPGTALFGSKRANSTYTAGNMKAAGIGISILGALVLVVSIFAPILER